MLDLAEKIVAGVGGALIVITLGVYAFIGVPSATSAIFVPEVKEVAQAPPPPAPNGAPQPVSPEDRAIIDKLREQGLRIADSQPLQKKMHLVPQETFEYISAEANWLPELKKIGRKDIGTSKGQTRTKLLSIPQDSTLKKLGFQENDIVELIDGQIIEFNEHSVTRYMELFRAAQKKLRQGQSISITVTRQNRPVHLEFKL